MEILKPVEKDSIPPRDGGGPGVHHALYEQVLALDGLALPVEFETVKKARHFRALLCHPRGRARRLGLRGCQRGKTVFLYCGDGK